MLKAVSTYISQIKQLWLVELVVYSNTTTNRKKKTDMNH